MQVLAEYLEAMSSCIDRRYSEFLNRVTRRARLVHHMLYCTSEEGRGPWQRSWAVASDSTRIPNVSITCYSECIYYLLFTIQCRFRLTL